MAQAPKHSADRASFVRDIVSDPKAVPDVMLLYGYLGASSEEGHERFREFPAVSPRFSGDDLFFDQQFLPTEKTVLETQPVIVRIPRRPATLLSTLRRNRRAKAQLNGWSTTPHTLQELGRSIRGPQSAIDAAVYAGFVTLARLRRRQRPESGGVWERDESSRL